MSSLPICAKRQRNGTESTPPYTRSSAVFGGLNAEGENGGEDHAGSAGDDDVERVNGGEVDQDFTEAEGDGDLWKDDEEVENAHIEAHFFGGEAIGKHGVGHGEDRGPADADPDHREKEEVFLRDRGDGHEAKATNDKAGDVDCLG